MVRAADRWRALDSDPTLACHTAARILRYLGARDLAWDYLTTPTAVRPNDPAPQLALAQTLRSEGEYDLADRAYALAFEAESTNAQILWERAQMLQDIDQVMWQADQFPNLPLYQQPTVLAYDDQYVNIIDNSTSEGFTWNAEQWGLKG